jgi:hypothetical protein
MSLYPNDAFYGQEPVGAEGEELRLGPQPVAALLDAAPDPEDGEFHFERDGEVFVDDDDSDEDLWREIDG